MSNMHCLRRVIERMKNIHIVLIVVIIVLLVIFGLSYRFYQTELKFQEECLGNECSIAKECSSRTDCFVGCGCQCVAKESICQIESITFNLTEGMV